MSRFAVKIGNYQFEVEVNDSVLNQPKMQVSVDGEIVEVIIPDLDLPSEEIEWIVVDNKPYEVVLDRDLRWIKSHHGLYPIEVRDMGLGMNRPTSIDGRIKAPIPGQITRVMVESGQSVETGQPLLVLEAMKMENEIHAPRSGVVKAINVTSGQRVTLHEVLAEIV